MSSELLDDESLNIDFWQIKCFAPQLIACPVVYIFQHALLPHINIVFRQAIKQTPKKFSQAFAVMLQQNLRLENSCSGKGHLD